MHQPMKAAMTEVVDPILLDARVVEPDACCNCCCCALREVPRRLCGCFDGDDLVLGNEGNQLFVTLGQFSIIRLERDIQLLMPAFDICLPRRDCSNSGAAGETQDPCAIFANFEFPIDEFFPPKQECPDCLPGGGSCGCGSGCGGGCNNAGAANNSCGNRNCN